MSGPSYSIVFSQVTLDKIRDYRQRLSDGTAHAGGRLSAQTWNDETSFINALLATKQPCIFAESAIRGDGSDWTADELSILGDINVTMPVDIFDNGTWSPDDPAFATHQPPLQGHLLFTPGPLLEPCCPDLTEVTTAGDIDQSKYNKMIERRLLPLLAHVNAQGIPAVVTLPGIGCGAFAGRFKGRMAAHLDVALQTLLQKYAPHLPHIAMVYFDPFDDRPPLDKDIGGIRYVSQPRGLPQLSSPADFGYAGHTLFKMVAWDHVSWPGNDFFAGSRFTDDGMAGAATDSMYRVTGVKGQYESGAYLPPAQFKTWENVTAGTNFSARSILVTTTGTTNCRPLSAQKPPLPPRHP